MQIIAYITMLLNHYGVSDWIGIALPIMIYFVAKGVERTKNLESYLQRVFLMGLISQIFWNKHIMHQNVNQFNDVLAIGFAIYTVYQKNEGIKLCLALSNILLGWLGLLSFVPLYMLLFAKYGKEKYLTGIAIIIPLLMIIDYHYIRWFLVIPLLYYFENIEIIRLPKMVKYSIYPAHLIILNLMR